MLTARCLVTLSSNGSPHSCVRVSSVYHRSELDYSRVGTRTNERTLVVLPFYSIVFIRILSFRFSFLIAVC